MLKCNIGASDAEFVAASGSTISLAADCLFLIGSVWSALKKKNDEAAHFFRQCIENGVTRDGTPVFVDEGYDGVSFVTSSPIGK